MIDWETLELIKNNQYSNGKSFSEELHELIHSFYEGFDLDKQNSKYRIDYITQFIEQHEDFIVNYVTNIFNPHIGKNDKLSDEITFCEFLDTLSVYLTKYKEEGES